jgi:hypothetical protein
VTGAMGTSSFFETVIFIPLVLCLARSCRKHVLAHLPATRVEKGRRPALPAGNAIFVCNLAGLNANAAWQIATATSARLASTGAMAFLTVRSVFEIRKGALPQ